MFVTKVLQCKRQPLSSCFYIVNAPEKLTSVLPWLEHSWEKAKLARNSEQRCLHCYRNGSGVLGTQPQSWGGGMPGPGESPPVSWCLGAAALLCGARAAGCRLLLKASEQLVLHRGISRCFLPPSQRQKQPLTCMCLCPPAPPQHESHWLLPRVRETSARMPLRLTEALWEV